MKDDHATTSRIRPDAQSGRAPGAWGALPSRVVRNRRAHAARTTLAR